MSEKQYEFSARIERVRFYNEENNYAILEFSTQENLPDCKYIPLVGHVGVLVGNCIPVAEMDQVKVVAKQVENQKWGTQYQIISLKGEVPTSKDQVLIFLKNFTSEDRANILYEIYPNIIDLVKQNSEFEPNYKLLKGIGATVWGKIREKIIDNYCYSDLIELLSPIGVTLTTIKKIANGNKNIALLRKQIIENPYILCKFKGLGFRKVDGYALKLNENLRYSTERATEGIKYILNDYANNEGHCYVNNQEFLKMYNSLIPQGQKALKQILIEQKKYTDNEDFNNKEFWLYVKNNKIGLLKYYNIEKSVFTNLCRLNNSKNNWKIPYKTFFQRLDIVEKKQGFKLDEVQLEAVRSVAEHNVTIIAGKAGAGKSSILRAVLEVYKDHTIAMCALSAKAAKRMREASGFQEAKTIHRLLGLLEKEDDPNNDFNETGKLNVELLIIDEVSMVNSSLLNMCLKACPDGTKIVLVGDKAQLPSIGVGRVLGDLLEYPVFNVHMLSKIYRQSEDSFISLHANIIRDGILPFDINKSMLSFGKDSKYIFKSESEDILNAILKIYIGFINRGVSFEDIAIVIPRKENTTISCRKVNETIMGILLKDEIRKIQVMDKEFKVGCRVLNKVNDYKKSVLNGDTGTVTKIIYKTTNNGSSYPSGAMIQFDDGDEVEFTKAEMQNLELGYAITCHSSQGSQYKIGIIALDFGSYSMLSSNLIYTAITRAKDNLIVIAEPRAFSKAVTNVTENERKTFLSCFLQQLQENPDMNIQNIKDKQDNNIENTENLNKETNDEESNFQNDIPSNQENIHNINETNVKVVNFFGKF